MVVVVMSVLAIEGRGAEVIASRRIALMDFSTDDNSYRSIQAAADFTSLVQLGLMGEAGVEWVERSQISLAKQEFGLAGMETAGGVSPLHQGRMLGADWMVTGHFSSDDQSRATLSVQVIELKHADVIADETFTLPDKGRGWIQLEPSQVTSAVGALRSVFAKARMRQQQATNQARVAFLFLADTSSWPASHGETDVLPREFSDGLERAATANGRIRLIHFPKAYQSTGESEMMVDGIIEAGQDSWNQMADVYAWGTYSVTNARVANRFESRLDLTLSLWDGVSQPKTWEESLRIGPRGNLSPELARDLVNRLVGHVIANSRPQRREQDSTVVRQQIADSIVKAYVAMTGHNRAQLGLHDRENFVQAVHMLEAACFFDPDSAEARVLWLTCRYGWWIDFGFNVKNQFWTKWRRSQAWGKYVDRFGLKPVGVELPFPYNARGGVPAIYTGSVEEVLRMFPQWDTLDYAVKDSAAEDQSRRQGVHTILMEAEFHGFPRQMPPELTMKWKSEISNELAGRKKRAEEYAQTQVNLTNVPSAKMPGRSVAVISNQPGSSPRPRPSAATRVQKSLPGVSAMVPTPEWFKHLMTMRGMFQLSAPNVQPHELQPEVQQIQFPSHFEVKVIKQLDYHKGRLWILAMDERSAPSSDATPDLSAETLDKRSRLWYLDADALTPDLFKADSLPARINSFLFHEDQLWLAGDSVGVLDLVNQSFRRFGLAEGLTMREVEALAFASGRMYAAGDSFKLSSLDPTSLHWENLTLPQTMFSHGSGNPYLLAGNQQWLAYAAGSTLFRDLVAGSWTNLALIKSARCFAPDGSACWIVAGNGLCCYATDTHTLRNWNAPTSIQSPMIGLIVNAYIGGGSTFPQDRVEQLERQIRGHLTRLASERQQRKADRKNQKSEIDPLHLTSRIPGGVAALANDGDFLWLGAGSNLLLLHKPSLSLVASCNLGDRRSIASLAISDTYVWAGTAYGSNLLLRLQKAEFLSVPRSDWVGLTMTPQERERFVKGMSLRGQALYAFFSGDEARVVQLLEGTDPGQASLEKMFLLAWCYDAAGVDDPQQAKTWCERIIANYPDSPWAEFAREAISENEVRHGEKQLLEQSLARFDRNRDQVLDDAEKRALAKDPSYLREQQALLVMQINWEMNQIVRRYDADGDGKLDEPELDSMTRMIRTLLIAQREMPQMADRSRLLTPLVSEQATAAPAILKRYDSDKDGMMNADELSTLALEIAKQEK